jgi:hypothetical protein
MALRSPTEAHAYWGQLASYAVLPNVLGSPAQKATLQIGDQAYVTGESASYVCTTATLGAAVWQRIVGAHGGVAVVDFGPYPGKTDAQLAVIAQPLIAATSSLRASIALVATADHSVDEHRVNPLYISAGSIVPGTGFTVYAQALQSREYGEWSVSWSWF